MVWGVSQRLIMMKLSLCIDTVTDTLDLASALKAVDDQSIQNPTKPSADQDLLLDEMAKVGFTHAPKGGE